VPFARLLLSLSRPQELVSKMSSQKFEVLIGVLETAHSIFYRYRHDMKSEKLWQEIAKVHKVIFDPLTKLFKVGVLIICSLVLRLCLAADVACISSVQQTLSMVKDNVVRKPFRCLVQRFPCSSSAFCLLLLLSCVRRVAVLRIEREHSTDGV
jgi:ABC-type anion transport system duplicated permease subunit